MFESKRWVGPGLAMALLVGGCGAGSDPGSPSSPDSGHLDVADSRGIWRWVGAVEETDVRMAVLVGMGRARLYFCGGADSYATTTRWFNVGFDGGEHLEFQEDDWRVHGHLAMRSVSGEVELGDDVTRMFSAELVAADTIAGLYEGKADCGRLGLIVSQADKDALPTAQGACVDTAEQQTQRVSPIAPIASETGKIQVRTPGDSDATLLLMAATLEPL